MNTSKRRGPLLWLAARTKLFWLVAVLIPVLYVISSGLTKPLAWYGVASPSPPLAASAGAPVGIDVEIRIAPWWELIYAPLSWASDQGLPIHEWYWSRFEIGCEPLTDLSEVPVRPALGN